MTLIYTDQKSLIKKPEENRVIGKAKAYRGLARMSADRETQKRHH
jgi:hypothetical protein